MVKSSEETLVHVKGRRLACHGAGNSGRPAMNLSGWRGREMPAFEKLPVPSQQVSNRNVM